MYRGDDRDAVYSSKPFRENCTLNTGCYCKEVI